MLCYIRQPKLSRRVNRTGFRNGPLGVKLLVSTSRILGAPRERVHRGAVASAASRACFHRLRRRSLASVRGRRDGRHMMPSEETVSLSNHAWFVGWRPLPVLRLHRLHRPGDGTPDEAGLVRTASNSPSFLVQARTSCGAFDVSFVQRKLVPSAHIRCKTTPIFRANATLARFAPRRLATSIPQRFSAEKRVTRDNRALAAS